MDAPDLTLSRRPPSFPGQAPGWLGIDAHHECRTPLQEIDMTPIERELVPVLIELIDEMAELHPRFQELLISARAVLTRLQTAESTEAPRL